MAGGSSRTQQPVSAVFNVAGDMTDQTAEKVRQILPRCAAEIDAEADQCVSLSGAARARAQSELLEAIADVLRHEIAPAPFASDEHSPYRRPRRCSTLTFGLVPELQSASGECLVLIADPEADACNQCKTVTARTKIRDDIEEVWDRRPFGLRTPPSWPVFVTGCDLQNVARRLHCMHRAFVFSVAVASRCLSQFDQARL